MDHDKQKILIIEDDAAISEVMTDKLSGEGYVVVQAHDGEEGLAKILSEKPNLIILDVFMPKKDGVTVLKELKAKDPDNKIPIIILSNSNDTANIANTMVSNTVAYFIKSDEQLEKIVDLVKEKLAS